MAANDETRILKNNSVEELRQKTNEVSLHLGDNKLLDSRLTDKVYSYSASAGQTIFEDARIEHKPEETVDNTSGYIILTGSPTIPSGFIAGASLTQSGGYSATIVSASSTKILVKNSSGTLNTGSNLVVGSDTIAHANVVRIVTESYPKGLLTVTKGGTELVQDAISVNGFHLPNYVLEVNLTGSPTIPASFTEGATLTQSNGFSGVLLSASTSKLRFKNASGTFSTSANLGAPHTDAANRIQAANISSSVAQGPGFGTAIELNTPASASDAIVIKTTNLVDAITEVQDDIGDIGLLQTNNTFDVVRSINELEVGIRGTSNNLVGTALTTTANDLLAAVNELDAEIHDVSSLNNASGYSATTVAGGITELQSHVGTKASLTTSTTSNLVAAINEVDANADASFKLTSSSTQTINSNTNFTNGKTFTFPSGSTLDIRQGSLLTGSGGGELTFDTAFLTLTVNDSSNSTVNQFGLEGRRAGSGTDVRVQWNETLVSSKPARAWQVQGLATDGTTSQTADIVTFYNAEDLIKSNTETGIDVTWDSTNQNFDFALTADPTISLAGDLSGSVALTNLATDTFTLTATIGANTVENSMLAGSIAASKLAGSIGNSKLSNSSITVSDGSNTSPVALGGTLTFSGTSGEVEVSENAGTVTVGLPNNVTVGGNLTITGNLDVNGTQTTINTSTLEIDDTLVLMGASNTEPTTGGFGLETRNFTGVGTHSNAASNVTGSHSIVYNFATDRWEADGSLILSTATQGAPNIEEDGVNKGDLSADNSLSFNDGVGINSDVTLNGGPSGDFDVKFDLQKAQADVLGGIEVGFTSSGRNFAVQLSGNDAYVNVPSDNTNTFRPVEVDTNGDNQVNSTLGSTETLRFKKGSNISLLEQGGIITISSTDTNTEYSTATSTTEGLVKLISNTDQTTAANSVSTTAGRTYGVQLNSSNQMVVNVPWSDTNTQLSDADVRGKISVSGSLSYDSGTGEISFTETNYDHWGLDIAGNLTSGTDQSNQNISSGHDVFFAGGSGMRVAKATSGSTHTITFTNTAQDTGVPALLGTSGNVTLNSGITAAEVRSAIGAGTSSLTLGTTASTALAGDTSIPQGTVTSVSANNGASSSGGNTPTISVNTDLSGRVTQIGAAGNHKLYQSTSSYDWFMVKSNTTYHWFRMNGDAHHDGNVIAYSTNTGSDIKLKENIVVIDGALAKVSQLKGVTFDWKDKKKGKSGGLIAQDVEKVLPTAVNEVETLGKEDETHKTVNYNAIIGLLVESVKELKAEIEELKKHK